MSSIIEHYGTPRRSGRYPWGSGDDPYQRATSFLGYIQELKAQGMSELDIAKGIGISTTQLRAKQHIAKTEKRAADVAMAIRLKDKGLSNVAIGERMGINESSVRSLLDPAIKERSEITTVTANVLKAAILSGDYIQIGTGADALMGISRTKLNNAVSILEEEGYTVHTIRVKQLGTDKYTNLKVLAPPETSFMDVYRNREKIIVLDHYSEDGGRSYLGLEPVQNVDRKRILIRYNEDGGALKDGVIELRPGVEDISLGNSHYAQVRIGVDGSHYMKGMAVYGDKFPPGIDMIYNTNKNRDIPPDEVFKSMKEDEDNPFGATIRQRHYIDANGDRQLSALNLVGYVEGAGEEGAWSNWSRNISSQILSKQPPKLAKAQLDLAASLRRDEFDEIMSLTNPSVRRKLLESFADAADADAGHLKAAALPRQATHVLLPVNSLADNEIFAPNYRDGEVVVLFRHPHGGIFEAPSLVVNNKNPEAIRMIGKDARDAVGINSKVAQQLSGADFDGDAVIVIPNRDRALRTAPLLEALKNFDPRVMYKGYDGMTPITKSGKQMEMGKVSNLITDMTIQGANPNEVARAIRHSMVVIDAEKHNLNYRQSYKDNGIEQLKEKYQGAANAGASTLISRASATVWTRHRKEGQLITDPNTGKTKRLYVDPVSGNKLFTESGELGRNKNGKLVPRVTKSTRMAETDDARKLSSGTVIESVYADYANRMKTLARSARLAALNTTDIPYSPSARKVWDNEVGSLRKKLTLAIMNKPLERQAQLLANRIVSAKKAANPEMDKADLKRLKGQSLVEARNRMHANKPLIQITDNEWQAIQAGAISPSFLTRILQNTDVDALKGRALPHQSIGMSSARANRAKAMLAAGNTRADVADALGVSLSVLDKALKES